MEQVRPAHVFWHLTPHLQRQCWYLPRWLVKCGCMMGKCEIITCASLLILMVAYLPSDYLKRVWNEPIPEVEENFAMVFCPIPHQLGIWHQDRKACLNICDVGGKVTRCVKGILHMVEVISYCTMNCITHVWAAEHATSIGLAFSSNNMMTLHVSDHCHAFDTCRCNNVMAFS